MEIHRMDHRTVGRVFQMNINRVAYPNTDERAGDLAIESPVTKRRAFGETAFHFDAEKVDSHGLWFALANGRGQVIRFAGNIRLYDCLRSGPWGDDELPLHP